MAAGGQGARKLLDPDGQTVEPQIGRVCYRVRACRGHRRSGWNRFIDIVASGLLKDVPVVQEEAIVGFVEGQSRLLKLFLATECRSDPCNDVRKTCTTGGACVDTVRPPGDLPPFDPGTIPKGADAGVDGGADTPRADSAVGTSTDGTHADVRADSAAPESSIDRLLDSADLSTPPTTDAPSAIGDALADTAPDAPANLPDSAAPSGDTAPDFPLPTLDLALATETGLDIGGVMADFSADAPDGGATAVDAQTPVDGLPAGAALQVSAGGDRTCAIRVDGTIACWGENKSGESTPAAGTFKQISAGTTFTCGLTSEGSIVCWGDNY